MQCMPAQRWMRALASMWQRAHPMHHTASQLKLHDLAIDGHNPWCKSAVWQQGIDRYSSQPLHHSCRYRRQFGCPIRVMSVKIPNLPSTLLFQTISLAPFGFQTPAYYNCPTRTHKGHMRPHKALYILQGLMLASKPCRAKPHMQGPPVDLAQVLKDKISELELGLGASSQAERDAAKARRKQLRCVCLFVVCIGTPI